MIIKARVEFASETWEAEVDIPMLLELLPPDTLDKDDDELLRIMEVAVEDEVWSQAYDNDFEPAISDLTIVKGQFNEQAVLRLLDECRAFRDRPKIDPNQLILEIE